VRTFTLTSRVEAPIAELWARVTSFAGVNHELMPWMRMTPPRRYRDASIDTVPTGVPLGRVTVWYFGFLPLDYDRMSFMEVAAGSHFHEVSTMASMRRWEHLRTLEPVGTGEETSVTDTIRFEPRIPGTARATEATLRALFAHRHRRLQQWFS